MTKSLKYWGIVLICSILILIQFVFFNISVSHSKSLYEITNNELHYTLNKVDSLEIVVNEYFKNKRDTIIINNYPQTIKIYQK